MLRTWSSALVLAPLLLGLSGCGECGAPPEVPGWAIRPRETPTDGLSGPATVTSLDPFTVTFDDGQYWTFLSEAPRAIPPGARVFVEVEEIWFGLNSQGGKVVVWALTLDETAGNVAFAAWYGPRYAALDVGDVSYTTEPTGSVCTDDCGHQYRSQIYQVRVGPLEAEVREETEVGPYTMWAEGYVDEGMSLGRCNDHAHGRLYGGRLERSDLSFELDPDQVNCQLLSPNACIEHARCALFGGDLLPYTCWPALPGCERMADPGLCVSDPGCVWLPGDCYCPAGTSCNCQGGKAPGCRTSCTASGTTWACMGSDLRFCEALPSGRADCAPEQPGVCWRRPSASECEAQDAQVCGCSPGDGQWRRMSACSRARGGVPFVATSTNCSE